MIWVYNPDNGVVICAPCKTASTSLEHSYYNRTNGHLKMWVREDLKNIYDKIARFNKCILLTRNSYDWYISGYRWLKAGKLPGEFNYPQDVGLLDHVNYIKAWTWHFRNAYIKTFDYRSSMRLAEIKTGHSDAQWKSHCVFSPNFAYNYIIPLSLRAKCHIIDIENQEQHEKAIKTVDESLELLNVNKNNDITKDDIKSEITPEVISAIDDIISYVKVEGEVNTL